MSLRPLTSLTRATPLALMPLAMAVHSALSTAQPIPRPPNQIDEVLVTATRMPLAESATLAQATVITRRDIETAGPVSLAELLQRRAHVEIRTTGGAGQPSGVFIRGANAQQTLVLVDGQRIASATSGSAAFEGIPLDSIERIEVVRGPMSGLYGSDAIGGVVQIFTRGHSAPRLVAEAGAGSQSTLGASAGFSTVEGKLSLNLNAAYRETNAQSATNARAASFVYNPDRDPYKNVNGSLKLSYEMWQGEVVTASAWQSRGRVKFDNGPAEDPRSEQNLTGFQVSSENNFAEFWRSTLRAGQTIDEIKSFYSFGGRFKTTQNQLSWQNQLKTPVGAWLIGYEHLEQRVGGTTDYNQPKRTTQSAFASVNESIDWQRLSGNVRYDREDQFGERTTGALSYGIQLADDEVVFMSAGRAFRAPSFNDLYFPGFSNPTLKPERSQSVEYGWRVKRPEFGFNLAVFDNRIDDLIAFDFATNAPQNIRRARIKGVEFGGSITWDGYKWSTALTTQRPLDGETNKQLRSRAKHFGTLALSKTFGKWDFTGDVNASSKRFDSANESPASMLPGYAVINGSVRYRVDKTWSVELSAQNLADKQYELARGYNTPGRALYVSVRANAR
jgi:vitamin B12 transporter